MSRKHSQGFTLVELLVVITIIAMLMALLLPAIDVVREGARQAQCTNRQREIAQGMFAHTSDVGHFPGRLQELRTNGAVVTWVTKTMPHLGRNDIWNSVQSGGSPSNYGVFVEMFVCPSDGAKPRNEPSLSYVANTGKNIDDSNELAANGVCHALNLGGPKVGLDDFLDGTSTTFLLSENVDADRWINNGNTEEHWHGMMWPFQKSINEDLQVQSPTAEHARPSSNHNNGVVVAFADAHVSFIKSDVDRNVLNLLMTPNGNQADPQQNQILDESQYK